VAFDDAQNFSAGTNASETFRQIRRFLSVILGAQHAHDDGDIRTGGTNFPINSPASERWQGSTQTIDERLLSARRWRRRRRECPRFRVINQGLQILGFQRFRMFRPTASRVLIELERILDEEPARGRFRHAVLNRRAGIAGEQPAAFQGIVTGGGRNHSTAGNPKDLQPLIDEAGSGAFTRLRSPTRRQQALVYWLRRALDQRFARR